MENVQNADAYHCNSIFGGWSESIVSLFKSFLFQFIRMRRRVYRVCASSSKTCETDSISISVCIKHFWMQVPRQELANLRPFPHQYHHHHTNNGWIDNVLSIVGESVSHAKKTLIDYQTNIERTSCKIQIGTKRPIETIIFKWLHLRPPYR